MHKIEEDARIDHELNKIPETIEPEETGREIELRPNTVQSPPPDALDANKQGDMAKQYATTPGAATASERPRTFTPALDEVDEDYESVTPIEINKDQLLRLIKTGVISESEAEGTYEEIAARSEAKI